MDNLTQAFKAAEDEAALIALLPDMQTGPGWAKPKPSIYPSPHRAFVAAHWRGDQARAALDSAARFVATDKAERRNLILINPHEGNDYATARTLVAAYQLVLASEQARSHRHTPNALRLVLDAAPGTYTIVDGQRIPMAPGDVLLTPNWLWHGHSNESPQDAFWIDFLDVPLIHLLEPMFYEQHPEWIEPGSAQVPNSQFRFAYEATAPALRRQAESQPGERWLRLGPPQMPTIGLDLRHFAAHAALTDPRTTLNRLYAVIEGEGETEIEGRHFTWRRGDVLVVPAWTPSAWRCTQDATLLCVSDRPVQEALNLLRTEV